MTRMRRERTFISSLKAYTLGAGDLLLSLTGYPSQDGAQEIDHLRVDVSSPFLLGPVAATRQDYRSAQLRNKFRHVSNALSHTRKAQYDIAFAGHVERRDGNFGTGKGSKKSPVAIDITVPIKTATKPGSREFGNIETHIGFREPRRQNFGILHFSEKTALSADHPGSVPVHDTTGEVWWIPRNRVKHDADRRANVVLKFGFGHT